MNKEYDFSKAERGKFYNPDIRLNTPVYLDSDVKEYLDDIAKIKKTNVQTIVNSLLRKDIQIKKAISI